MKVNANRVFQVLLAGMIVGSVLSIVSVSYAALIFQGELKQFIVIGASCALIGSIIITIGLALSSTSKLTIGNAQDIFAVIIGLVATGIAHDVAKINSNDILATVLAAIILMSISTGVVMFLMGQLRLGKLVRFFPYPVIAGFLAGTGWLIFAGAFSVLTSVPLSFATMSLLFSSQYLWLWLMPLGYAVFMLITMRMISHFLIFPMLLLTALVLFYVFIYCSGISVETAMANHWMMGPFPDGKLAAIPSFSLLSLNVQWGVIAHYIPDFLTCTAMAVISLLLNVSSFEILAKKNVDVDRELKATGIINSLSGIFGGLGGYQSLSLSKINLNFNFNSRFVGAIAGLVPLLIIFLGTPILTYLPKFVFGAILLYMALDFMGEWLIEIKKKLSWPDYLIVVTITLTIIIKGLLIGVGIGLLLSLILFFVHYSHIEAIRTIMKGSIMRSNVDRNVSEKALLQQYGDHILIPIIAGYLFYGNSFHIVQTITHEVDKEHSTIKYIVIDFSRVTGLDVSCYMSFIKLLQFAKQNNVSIVFAHLPEQIKTEINRFVEAESDDLDYKEFKDLDQSIEWCEDQIINDSEKLPTVQEPTEKDFFKENQTVLENYFDKVECEKDHVIYKQGEEGHDLYWLAQGCVNVLLNHGTKKEIRLTKMKEGTIVGGMGMFLKQPRSASVVATEHCVLYKMNDKQLMALYQDNPQLGISFNTNLINMLAKRLLQANKFTNFIKCHVLTKD